MSNQNNKVVNKPDIKDSVPQFIKTGFSKYKSILPGLAIGLMAKHPILGVVANIAFNQIFEMKKNNTSLAQNFKDGFIKESELDLKQTGTQVGISNIKGVVDEKELFGKVVDVDKSNLAKLDPNIVGKNHQILSPTNTVFGANVSTDVETLKEEVKPSSVKSKEVKNSVVNNVTNVDKEIEKPKEDTQSVPKETEEVKEVSNENNNNENNNTDNEIESGSNVIKQAVPNVIETKSDEVSKVANEVVNEVIPEAKVVSDEVIKIKDDNAVSLEEKINGELSIDFDMFDVNTETESVDDVDLDL